jgi:hypothetical protein
VLSAIALLAAVLALVLGARRLVLARRSRLTPKQRRAIATHLRLANPPEKK